MGTTHIHSSVIDVVKARVGTRIRGKWRVDTLLGVGGMGAVYAATHRNGNRVALKVLHTQLSVDAEVRARFAREGYVANSVSHPAVVRVLDDDETEDGSAFIVMELLEGETADTRANRLGGRLPVEDVVALSDVLLDVLAASHAGGIVHRDIKPENVFFTRDGFVKVLDFGIARLKDGFGSLGDARDAVASQTRAGVTMGTPAFMPPEQALGRVHEVDPLSDIWAAGATMFALLAGRPVHDANTPMELVIAAATAHARSLGTAAPELPASLVAVVDRALSFHKTDRWPSARAMQSALRKSAPSLLPPPREGPRPAVGPASSDAPPHSVPLSLRSSTPPSYQPSRAGPTWVEERRLATVLFGELVGFSAVTNDLEPDAIRELANEFFEPLSREIEREGGAVVKYIGDSVMAVFGVPASREDDAQRAMRASIAMAGRVREIARKHGNDIRLRVGANSGVVMVGTVGGSARAVPDVIGATVNLANRIGAAAAPGDIVIGPGAERLVRGSFELTDLGEVELQGIGEKVALYRVESEKGEEAQSSHRFRGDADTSFFARKSELAMLLRAYESVSVERGLRLVELTGEVGLGKGHLIRQLRAELEANDPVPHVLQTARSATGAPHGFLGRLLRARFHVRIDEEPAAVRARVIDGVAAAWDPAEVDDGREAGRLLAELVAPLPATPFLGTEIAVDPTRTANAFTDWLKRLAQKRPVCLIVEQVHWMDDASLDLLEFLIRALRKTAVLIVISGRPDSSEQIPAWLTGCDVRTKIELTPFSQEVMQDFIDDLFRRVPGFPRELRDEIVRRSEGNPALCKELVRLLVDRGALVVDETNAPVRWEKSRSHKLVLPDSILGVLQARLDGLSLPQRELLKLASVVGRVFWLGALESLIAEGSKEEIASLLDSLRARELVRERTVSSLTGEREFWFATQALRDAAYELVPRAVRTAAHRRVADWLLERGELWEGGHADLALHLDEAGDHERARRHYLNAARHASAVCAHREAVAFFEKMSASWPPETSADDRILRAGVRRERAASEMRVGRFEDAIASLERAAEDLSSAGVPEGDEALGWVFLERGLVLKEFGHVDASMEAFGKGLELATKGPPALLLMRLYSARAFQRGSKGDRPGARADCEAGLAVGQALHVRDLAWHIAMARLKDALGTQHVFEGDLDGAEQAYRRALEHRETAGDLVGAQDAFVNLGGIAFTRRDFASASLYYEKALAAAKKARWASRETIGHSNLGQARLAAGHVGAAIEELELACRLAEESGYLDVLADSSRALAEARLAHGDVEDALRTAREAIRHGERSGAPLFVAMAHAAAMDCLLARMNLTRERDAFREAVCHRDAALAIFEGARQAALAESLRRRFMKGSNATVNA